MNKLVFYIPFNSINVLGQLPKALTKDWIDYRMEIFMKYTLSSLKKQTHQDFLAYLLYHPHSKHLVKQALAKYPDLPPNVIATTDKEHLHSLERYTQSDETFFLISLYSDDLYHRNFTQFLSTYEPDSETEVLICQKGYLYHSPSNKLIQYYNFSSSFNVFIYSKNEYFSGYRYPMNSYMSAIQLKHEILDYPFYINHCHNLNSDLTFCKQFSKPNHFNPWSYNGDARVVRGAEITSISKKNLILKDFM